MSDLIQCWISIDARLVILPQHSKKGQSIPLQPADPTQRYLQEAIPLIWHLVSSKGHVIIWRVHSTNTTAEKSKTTLNQKSKTKLFLIIVQYNSAD